AAHRRVPVDQPGDFGGDEPLEPQADGAGAMTTVKALFGTRLNAALTLVMLALIYLAGPPFLEWALAHATWDGLTRKACAPDGACWAFVKARFALFIYGRYPQPERWRVDLVLLLLAITATGALWGRWRSIFIALLLLGMPLVGGVLLIGGVFGLQFVDT